MKHGAEHAESRKDCPCQPHAHHAWREETLKSAPSSSITTTLIIIISISLFCIVIFTNNHDFEKPEQAGQELQFPLHRELGKHKQEADSPNYYDGGSDDDWLHLYSSHPVILPRKIENYVLIRAKPALIHMINGSDIGQMFLD